MLINIGKELQVTIKKEDIDCIKIGKEGKEKLKVIFKADKQKKDIMKNKKGKKLNSINFGFTEKLDVFINHDLTTENQSLYKKIEN